jgi:hypothetical protein
MTLLLQIKSKWCPRSVKNDEESAVRYHAAAKGASPAAEKCRASQGWWEESSAFKPFTLFVSQPASATVVNM